MLYAWNAAVTICDRCRPPKLLNTTLYLWTTNRKILWQDKCFLSYLVLNKQKRNEFFLNSAISLCRSICRRIFTRFHDFVFFFFIFTFSTTFLCKKKYVKTLGKRWLKSFAKVQSELVLTMETRPQTWMLCRWCRDAFTEKIMIFFNCEEKNPSPYLIQKEGFVKRLNNKVKGCDFFLYCMQPPALYTTIYVYHQNAGLYTRIYSAHHIHSCCRERVMSTKWCSQLFRSN